jgi:hypothetical protein
VVDRHRARELARVAAGLAAGAGIDLPGDLDLWELAGGRPAAVDPVPSPDPAAALGVALEARLTASERGRGAHFTPAAVADRLVHLALPEVDRRRPPAVCDPACGAGAVLLAAGRRLVAAGLPARTVARDLLWGADLDPLSAAVTAASLALWSGGSAPAAGHVVGGDPLHRGAETWSSVPHGGFGAVVGNPPFQGQLARATVRGRDGTARLRERFGRSAVAPYVDTAAVFLLAAVDLAAVGARVVLVQPTSVVASRDASGVRAVLAGTAAPVSIWAPGDRLFDAAVHVCVPVLVVGHRSSGEWATLVATDRGVPTVRLAGRRRLGDVADLVAGFRDEYYGLVPHVREGAIAIAIAIAGASASASTGGRPDDGPADRSPDLPAALVTSGLIDVGRLAWGSRPARFAKQRWQAPVVDVAGVASSGGRVAGYVHRVRRPKVLVATQTRVLEAVADPGGAAVPVTPVISVVPGAPEDVPAIEALLSSPVVSAWVAARTVGTGLSTGSMRPTAGLLADLPLPDDDETWQRGTDGFEAWRTQGGDPGRWAETLAAAHGVADAPAAAALEWWLAQVPRGR